MRSVIIVSSDEKFTEFFARLGDRITFEEVTVVSSCEKARRIMLERSFDLCVINCPLPDETGYRLAADVIGEKANQVMLLVKSEWAEEISARVEKYGVFTVEKPLSRSAFVSAIRMAEAAFLRLKNLRTETEKLTRSIDEIKLISRAKLLLVERKGISEERAHKEIERAAMDGRKTKAQIAAEIIEKYEN